MPSGITVITFDALTHTSNQEFLRHFENMIIRAVVGSTVPRGVGTN